MTHWYYSVSLIGIVSGLICSATAALSFPLAQNGTHLLSQPNPSQPNPSQSNPPQTTESLLRSLPDGAYQFCTEPAPQDWRDGAGACLNVVKQGTTLDGYYGYPHSESFVCLHGQVSDNELHGNGFVISWLAHPWSEIPQAPFLWDEEGLLSLSGAAVARTEGDVSWITFQQADLNMAGLHLYAIPQMNPPDQLCGWRSK